MQQLVSDNVLGPGELLTADITGVFVVILRAGTTNINTSLATSLTPLTCESSYVV